MAKNFSVYALLKGKDEASGPVVRGLGKIRAAGVLTGKAVSKALSFATLGGVTGLGGAALGIKSLVTSYTSATDEESKFARQHRISIGALQEFNYVAGREGVTVDALKQSITGLSQNVGQMAAGRGRALKFLSALKGGKEIARDLTKTTNSLEALDVALDAIRRTGGVNQKAALAKALGLDESVVRLAARTKPEIEALRAEMRGYGTDTTATGLAAEDFQDATERMDAALSGVKRTIGQVLAQPVQGYLDEFTTYVAANREQVRGWAADLRDGLEAVIVTGRTLGKVLSPVVDAIQIVSEGAAGAASVVSGSGPGRESSESFNDRRRKGYIAAGYTPAEMAAAEAQALAEGLPTQDSRGNKAWDVIGNTARRMRQNPSAARAAFDAGTASVLPVATQSRPAFGTEGFKGAIQVWVQDDRVTVRSVKEDGPVALTAETGVAPAFAGGGL